MRNIATPSLFSVTEFHTHLEFHFDEKFFTNGESHDFWEIVFVESGEVDITEGTQVYRLKGGEMIFHAPNEFHNIRSADETTPHVFILTFSAQGRLPEGLSDGIFVLQGELRRNFDEMFATVGQLFRQEKDDEFFPQQCARRLEDFLIQTRRAPTLEPNRLLSHGAQEYHRLVVSMAETVCENLSLEDFSQKHNISISYIKVLFRRYAGISPKAYYARLRCEEAVRLLQSGYSAAETADRLKFSSPNHFSVFFKRMTGQPPVRYIVKKEHKL